MKPWTIPNSAGLPSRRLRGVHAPASQPQPPRSGRDEQDARGSARTPTPSTPSTSVRTISATPISTIRIGQQQRADHHTTAARSSALRRALSGAGADSMITRQGRSASTVSSVLPNSEAPLTRCGQRHHDRRRAHVGGLLDDPPPGLAGAHALDVAGHARADLHAGLLDDRLRGGLLPPASARRSAARSARSPSRAYGCRGGGARRAWPRWRPPTRRSARRPSAPARSRTRPRDRPPAAGSRPCASRSGPGPAGGGRGSRRPCRAPASRRRRRRRWGSGRRSRRTRPPVKKPARDREQRPRRRPRHVHVARALVGPREVRLGHPQPDHRQVRHRERQHRAERVDAAEEHRLARAA